MTSTSQDIAIIGAGMAGLSAGLRLAAAGHRISLFERFDEPKSIGAGILLQPSGLVALDRLGLLERVETTSARIDALIGDTKTGRRIMNVRYADVWPGVYGLGIHRGNLFRVLYEAATAAIRTSPPPSMERARGEEVMQPGVRCATEIASIDALGNQKYACRSVTGEVYGEYDAVIIANGTQSQLRAGVRCRQRNIAYPWGALWAICPDPESRFRHELLQRYDGTSVMIGVLPTGRHPQTGVPCVSFFWSLRTRDFSAWQQGSVSAWKRRVLDYWPALDYLIGDLDDPAAFTFATYGDVVMNRWHDGGIVCIGDAGHGMSPQLGQGANLALIDAIVLADCIEAAPSLAEAFARYSRARRRHLKYCQLASRWLTPFFQSDSRLAALARDISFPLLNKLPYFYKQAIRTVAGVKTGLLFDRPVMEVGGVNSVAAMARQKPSA